ncbi:MAG: hypothetical protein ACOX68_04090 [Candidatus Limivicinus sp.]|jgi:hypothetical protein
MVKLIMGLKGSGKTKRLVKMVCDAAADEKNDVVVIEKERNLTYDIPHNVRLIDAGSYDIGSYELLRGLICGIRAGNYDITHIFIDNFLKLAGDKSPEAFSSFIKWLKKFSDDENIEFTLSVSADAGTALEDVKAYII